MSRYGGMVRFVVSLAVCQAAGFVGSLFTRPEIETWYSELAKPAFNPPAWVFAPVWITLYLLMGIALFMVWQRGAAGGVRIRGPVALFSVQLALNVLWPVVFFGMHATGGGLLVIYALWIMIFATMMSFYRVSPPAAWLLLPYLLWVSFASVLNLHIWRLNP